MGEVLAARPISAPAQTVVIKVLRPDMADTPRARDFFERETKYTAKLNHPYVVRMLDSGVDEQLGPCLVLEFVPGMTLEAVLLRQNTVSLDRAAVLLGCICHGLSAAHTVGLVHRDLKPANLMLVNVNTPDEFLKVMDFGLAQLASKPYLTMERLSGDDIVIAQGTPAYISPEQIRGDDVDGRADIYATGVILYEMLTGHHPFPYPEPESVIEAHLKEYPPSFSRVNAPPLPVAVERVVMRCLSKYAPERPANMRELALDFSMAINHDIWELTMTDADASKRGDLPIAEDVAPEPVSTNPWHVVKRLETRMSDRIAVLKIGGFIRDLQAEILSTEPGLVRARLMIDRPATGLISKWFGIKRQDAIDLDVQLDRPIPNDSRLNLTMIFRPKDDQTPGNQASYFQFCDFFLDEIRKYLM